MEYESVASRSMVSRSCVGVVLVVVGGTHHTIENGTFVATGQPQ